MDEGGSEGGRESEVREREAVRELLSVKRH